MEQLTLAVGMSVFNAVSARFVVPWNTHHLNVLVLKLIFNTLLCLFSIFYLPPLMWLAGEFISRSLVKRMNSLANTVERYDKRFSFLQILMIWYKGNDMSVFFWQLLFVLSRHAAQRGVTTQIHRNGYGGQIKCVIMVVDGIVALVSKIALVCGSFREADDFSILLSAI